MATRVEGPDGIFLRRWLTVYAAVGLLAGLGYQFVQRIDFGLYHAPLLWTPIAGLFYFILLLIVASAQWQCLHQLVPQLSRWWIAATVGGALVTLGWAVATRWNMTVNPLTPVAHVVDAVGAPGVTISTGRLTALLYLGSCLLAVTLAQVVVLERAMPRAQWWGVVSLAGAVASVVITRAFSGLPGLSIEHTPGTDLTGFGTTIALTTVSYASYGAVTGIGIIALTWQKGVEKSNREDG